GVLRLLPHRRRRPVRVKALSEPGGHRSAIALLLRAPGGAIYVPVAPSIKLSTPPASSLRACRPRPQPSALDSGDLRPLQADPCHQSPRVEDERVYVVPQRRRRERVDGTRPARSASA